MPLFDFSNAGTPTVKSGFWIYWAITIPLTTIVLAAYLTYLARIQRRDRLEDLKILRRMNNETKGLSTQAAYSAHAISMEGMVRKRTHAPGTKARFSRDNQWRLSSYDRRDDGLD